MHKFLLLLNSGHQAKVMGALEIQYKVRHRRLILSWTMFCISSKLLCLSNDRARMGYQGGVTAEEDGALTHCPQQSQSCVVVRAAGRPGTFKCQPQAIWKLSE